MRIDKHAAKAAFSEYVKNYNDKDEKVRLKIEHTYRVCALSEEIAKSVPMTDADAELAWLIGLLHDIGRFEQLRQFNTFIDAESVDHAMLGSRILFEDGEIRRFVSDSSNDALIKSAIEAHSLYRLPEGMDDRTAMFANILRDADKIDILRVNVEFRPEEIYNVTSEELRNAEVTEEVMQSFFEEHATLRSLKKTPIDHLAGHISLIYELVYPYSVRVMKEQGFLEKMLAFRSDNPATNEQFSIIAKRINTYVEKRMSEIDRRIDRD